MSVQINCDRCGKSTRDYFVNAAIKVRRGAFANHTSKLSPVNATSNWGKEWHLCEGCCASLKRWTEPGTKVVYEIELDAA